MRVDGPVGRLPSISLLGEANHPNVKCALMALNYLQEPRDIKITQFKHEESPFLFELFTTRSI